MTAPTGSGDNITIQLPEKHINSFGVDEYSTSRDSVSIAITDEGSGAFRALVHIGNKNSSHEFKYHFPSEAQLSHLPDGGIAVHGACGTLLGTLDAPWAIDIKGDHVHTWYEIKDNELIQHVTQTKPAQYPIVADPFWIPFLGIVGGYFTRHALKQIAKRKISKELVKTVIQNERSSRGNGNSTIFTGNGNRVIVDNNSANIITVTRY